MAGKLTKHRGLESVTICYRQRLMHNMRHVDALKSR